MSSCGRFLLHLCYFINISEMGKSSGLKKFMPDEFLLCTHAWFSKGLKKMPSCDCEKKSLLKPVFSLTWWLDRRKVTGSYP